MSICTLWPRMDGMRSPHPTPPQTLVHHQQPGYSSQLSCEPSWGEEWGGGYKLAWTPGVLI